MPNTLWNVAFGLGILGCSSSSGAPAPRVDAGAADTARAAHDAARSADAPHSVDATKAPEAGEAGEAAAFTCATVQTAGGPVQGIVEGATCTYQGVPFAAPPVGPLRWKPPQPVMPWTTPRPSAPASACPQVASVFGEASTSEDCLYLNVWAPGGSAPHPRPVMVFVYGGGFVYGSATLPLYDATNLAHATDNLVVTINYRLGALGFLSDPALRAEDATVPTSGNYGLLDQIAAFSWVKANIAAFGGDPTKVTIFGESAGGSSMLVHLASPRSQGLFQRVIVESAFVANKAGAWPTSTADPIGSSFEAAVGCTDPSTLLTCLRAVPVATLLTASDNAEMGLAFNWRPVIDNVVLTEDLLPTLASGSFNPVPTLIGTNKNEGTLFASLSTPTDPTSYQAFAETTFPGNGAAIVAQYPITSFGGSYFTAASELLTDGGFVCPARTVARAISATEPVFRYDFVHAITSPVPNLGVFHGSELLFVFGNPDGAFGSLEASEQPLSALVMGYWGSMAAAGNPNGDGRFSWPQYNTATETNLVLDLTPSTETLLKETPCDFWDSLP